jgi:L-threonylcarbamoyladenylate synthase
MRMTTTSDIADVIACLNGGGVALIPTDTVFGLAARPDRPAAVAKIFALKRRPANVHLPVLVSSREDIERLGAEVNRPAAKLLASGLMPGALTLALGLREERAPWLQGRIEVAVRIPDDERCLAVIAQTGPILATSANAHGAGNALDAETILAGLNGAPDIVLSGGVRSEVASTIVNCRISPVRIERQGRFPAAEIERLLADG